MNEFRFGENDIREISRNMENSYFAYERLHHIDSAYLPSRHAIHELTRGMFALVYPGFYGRQDLTAGNVTAHVRLQVEKLGQALYEQVVHCFDRRKENGSSDTHARASEVVVSFLRRLAHTREVIASDALAAFRGDPAAVDTDEVIFCYPATLAITTYRLAHELLELGVPLMPRIMTEHAHSLTGVDIHPGTQIGKGFFIDHGTGVVIGETTIIGDNCKLYQGVTLGALSFPHDERGQIIRGRKRHPTLEDEVVVYANATILGDVTIGKGATVGGNIFVTESVPAGCTVSSKKAELRFKKRAVQVDRPQVDEYEI